MGSDANLASPQRVDDFDGESSGILILRYRANDGHEGTSSRVQRVDDFDGESDAILNLRDRANDGHGGTSKVQGCCSSSSSMGGMPFLF